MSRSPASVIVDSTGNLVGVVYDGTVYRLQVEATIVNAEGVSADILTQGNLNAQAVESHSATLLLGKILDELGAIRRHLEAITEEDDPL